MTEDLISAMNAISHRSLAEPVVLSVAEWNGLVDHIVDINKKVSERDELQRQMLALREALADLTAQAEDDDAKMLGSISHGAIVAARQALTDTAQAGREAEARVLEQAGAEMLSEEEPEAYMWDLSDVNGWLKEKANRLRNGESTDGA